MRRTAIVWHNIATDIDGRPLGMHDGFKPHHAVTPVMMIDLSATIMTGLPSGTPGDEGDALSAAEVIYALLNVGDDPSFGQPDPRALTYRARGNRSLSVGDVIQFTADGAVTEWWAVAVVGFTHVPTPESLAVGASAYGSHGIIL